MPSPAPLILASTSRYRRELLQRLGLPFTVEAPGVDEAASAGETPLARAERLALAKATAVAARHPDATVIGSDQVALCGSVVLDKPGNAATCRLQLQQLSGQQARFHTAVAIVQHSRDWRDCFIDLTTVQFRTLDEATITRYVAAEQPFDCAGGFRAEGLGISLFTGIDSRDPTGLVGLPLIRVATALRAAGYAIP